MFLLCLFDFTGVHPQMIKVNVESIITLILLIHIKWTSSLCTPYRVGEYCVNGTVSFPVCPFRECRDVQPCPPNAVCPGDGTQHLECSFESEYIHECTPSYQDYIGNPNVTITCKCFWVDPDLSPKKQYDILVVVLFFIVLTTIGTVFVFMSRKKEEESARRRRSVREPAAVEVNVDVDVGVEIGIEAPQRGSGAPQRGSEAPQGVNDTPSRITPEQSDGGNVVSDQKDDLPQKDSIDKPVATIANVPDVPAPIKVDVPNEMRCCVCLDRSRSILFQPCRHIACCLECSDKIDNKCPLCRKSIVSFIKIYLS